MRGSARVRSGAKYLKTLAARPDPRQAQDPAAACSVTQYRGTQYELSGISRSLPVGSTALSAAQLFAPVRDQLMTGGGGTPPMLAVCKISGGYSCGDARTFSRST